MSLQIVRFTALDDEVDRPGRRRPLFGAVRAAQPEHRYVAMPAQTSRLPARAPPRCWCTESATRHPAPRSVETVPVVPRAIRCAPETVPGTHQMLDRYAG